MISGSCHCGAVQVELPRRPRRLTSCNCSLCRRYASLMAYYPFSAVRLRAKRGALQYYCWGDRMIKFARCKSCGCMLGWLPVDPRKVTRAGINMRNFDPALLAGLRVRRFDGADTWKYLD